MSDRTRNALAVLTALSFGLSAAVMGVSSHHNTSDSARFLVGSADPPAPAVSAAPKREFIVGERDGHAVHVASIAALQDGMLAACWYGGTREGATDVSLYLSTKKQDDSRWSDPEIIVDVARVRRDLGTYVRKVGNAVLYADADDRLVLVFVSIAVGGWAGSSLNITWSEDRGASWQRIQALRLSPFFNVSELVKTPPSILSDGSACLPIYHENMGKFPEALFLRIDGGGAVARKVRIAGGRSYIQPAIVPVNDRRAVAFMRCTSARHRVGRSITDDAGRTWSPIGEIDYPNPNAAIDAIRLQDGRILMVANRDPERRVDLTLSLSDDEGDSWRDVAVIEADDGAGQYPYMMQTADGMIHVVYTWHRKRIAHVRFSEAWVHERVREANPR